MSWKTYLVMYFGSQKTKPSEIAKKLEDLGFETTFGSVDFVYHWGRRPTKDQVLELADHITNTLSNTGAVFNLDTHD